MFAKTEFFIHELNTTRENYKIWSARRFNREEFRELTPESRLAYLALCGHLAPNTHNTQPWQFALHPQENTLEVVLDRRSVLPVSDGMGRQAAVSVGCAIGNIITASKYFGIHPEVNISEVDPNEVKPLGDTDENPHVVVARIGLNKEISGEPLGREYLDAIFERRSHRGIYQKKVIPEKVYEKVKQIGLDHGVSFHLLSRSSISEWGKRIALAEAQAQADSYVINDEKFRAELSHWFLPNDTESKVGMPGNTFGLGDNDSREISDKLKGERMKIDDIVGFVQGGKKGIESAALVGILSVKNNIPQEWVLVGVALEEVILYLQTHGISSAFHAGLAEADNVLGIRLVSRGLELIFPIKGEYPMILFRAGYSEDKRPHAPRKMMESVILASPTFSR